MSNQTNKPEKRIRFAIYSRYSSEQQNELSLEDQEKFCRREIAERGGVVINVYTDAARSGWSLDRNGFTQLRNDAERGKFDAVMFWKFDRLARNHEHAVMIKILLRREYGLKLHCVEGFSEDDDDSPYTAMMEQLLAVFYAFYSKNLSTDTKRAKIGRVEEGKFNGSVAPIGYDLVTIAQASPGRPAGLIINYRVAAIVRRAFKMYLTGDYSDGDIANWMNKKKAVQRARIGRKPMDKEVVRDMLQNRTYTGRVCYADTQYSGSLGEGKKSTRHRKVWYEGRHQGFISDELFDACQVVRSEVGGLHASPSRMNTYIMVNRVYCARCAINKPAGLTDDRYGKMRPSADDRHSMPRARYRCLSKDRGYDHCGQKQVLVEDIDRQVVDVLTNMQIPDGFRERVEAAVKNRVENAAALQRMEEIKQIIERVDLRWDEGFISKAEYVEKRRQLQQEYDSLRPIDYDELTEAADLLEHFRAYWDECANTADPLEARQQLVSKVIDRVLVYDEAIVAVVLHGNFAIVLGENRTAPAMVASAVSEVLLNEGIAPSLDSSNCGSDGTWIFPNHKCLPCVWYDCIITHLLRKLPVFTSKSSISTTVVIVVRATPVKIIRITCCPIGNGRYIRYVHQLLQEGLRFNCHHRSLRTTIQVNCL